MMEARKCRNSTKSKGNCSCSFYATLVSLFVLLWIVAYGARYGVPSIRDIKTNIASYNIYTPFRPSPAHVAPQQLTSFDDLVAAIRGAAARAGTVEVDEDLSDEDRRAWEEKNPCRSRSELQRMYDRRKFARDVAPNSKWETVMEEYSRLHRTCLRNVGNLTDSFLTHNSSTGCKFLILETPKVGLGNKLLLKASATLFAVLTQRVLLMYPDSQASLGNLCEPFVGSSWKLGEEDHDSIENYNHVWQSTGAFQKWVDRSEIDHGAMDEFYAANLNSPWQPMIRFYCNTEQAYLSKVPWISISGCLYFLPKLFAIPAFRPALEELFPDRMALTHILRSVLLPADHVWQRIRNVNDVYLAHSQKQVGVQLRFFGLQSQYRRTNDVVNENVLQCAYENGFLPRVLPPGVFHPYPQDSSLYGHHQNTTKVFIASLFPGLHDHLKQMYVRRMTETGEGVGLVQLTSESEQDFGGEVDVEAFVEIICLSLSDVLLVTPWSTFGGAAQAYGALKPWFINYGDDGAPCDRAQTVDVCFDQAREDFLCPHDPALHGKSLLSHVPYIERCLREDADGVQLMTDHESNTPMFPTR